MPQNVTVCPQDSRNGLVKLYRLSQVGLRTVLTSAVLQFPAFVGSVVCCYKPLVEGMNPLAQVHV